MGQCDECVRRIQRGLAMQGSWEVTAQPDGWARSSQPLDEDDFFLKETNSDNGTDYCERGPGKLT